MWREIANMGAKRMKECEELKLHLQGFLESDSDGIRFKGKWDSIARQIAESEIGMRGGCSTHQPVAEEDYNTDSSTLVSNVFVQLFISDEQLTLEEAEKKQILQSLGILDIYTSWYGYSEYTIEGYNVENFTIGNHDLEQILNNYAGKYAHIVIEVK